MKEPQLTDSVKYVKGVGEKVAVLLAKKDIRSVRDLLYFLPRAYEDRRRILNVRELPPQGTHVVIGKIAKSHPVFYNKSRRKTFEVTLEDLRGGLGQLQLTWFHAPYLAKRLTEGLHVIATGAVQFFRGRAQMVHPEIEILGKNFEGEQAVSRGIAPVYSETAGLYGKAVRRMISEAFAKYSAFLPDDLPEEIRVRRGLPKLGEALKSLHRPPENADIEALNSQKTLWQRRLIYDEFFNLSLGIAVQKSKYLKAEGIAFPKPDKYWEQLKNNLPFKFTNAQRRVLQEVLNDMTAPHIMHRLVQGDVGSGKTVIAAAAALVALEAGFQVALMAPTEILIQQHARNFKKWFEGMPITTEILTGSSSKKEKMRILEQLRLGEIRCIFGTHALFEDEVKFKNLGLVIVDEQHRFGVHQRARLVEKGPSPDLLVMTATPIPRTLALTVYGDLSISVIDELPPDRKPIQTRVFLQSQKSLIEEKVKRELVEGRQAYFVFPLIEESEELKLQNLEEALPEIQKAYANFKIGVLHGRLKNDEKEKILSAFRENEIQILVSTTVVEVGVDVPNATVMVISNAEHFGLSQLHQLRGRVGRGQHESFCLLVASHLGTPEILQRLRAMETIRDGFKLSEIDLEMRGPGEILGTRQSGEPVFSLARLPRDLKILEEAREDAEALLAADSGLNQHPRLKARLGEVSKKALLN